QEIKSQCKKDECQEDERQIQIRNPRLQWDRELKIDFCNAGEFFAVEAGVKGKQEDDAKPEEHEKRDDVFRPPMPIFTHAVSMAQCPGNSGDKASRKINR